MVHFGSWLMLPTTVSLFLKFKLTRYLTILQLYPQNVIHPVKHLRTTLSNLQSIHKKWHLPPHYYFWKTEKRVRKKKFKDVFVWRSKCSALCLISILVMHTAIQHTHTENRVFVWWVTCEVTNLLARNHLVSLIWRRLWYFLFDGEKRGESIERESEAAVCVCVCWENMLRVTILVWEGYDLKLAHATRSNW